MNMGSYIQESRQLKLYWSRFSALEGPLSRKRKKVEEKDNLREFNRLAGDEEQYLKEKQISLDNKNLGLLPPSEQIQIYYRDFCCCSNQLYEELKNIGNRVFVFCLWSRCIILISNYYNFLWSPYKLLRTLENDAKPIQDKPWWKRRCCWQSTRLSWVTGRGINPPTRSISII